VSVLFRNKGGNVFTLYITLPRCAVDPWYWWYIWTRDSERVDRRTILFAVTVAANWCDFYISRTSSARQYRIVSICRYRYRASNIIF